MSGMGTGNNKMVTLLDKLERYKKRVLIVMGDLFLLPLVLWLSFSLRLGEWYYPGFPTIVLFLIAPVIAIPIFIKLGLYRAIIRYLGFEVLWTVLKAVSLYALIWGLVVLISGLPDVPRSTIIINWFLAVLIIGGERIVARWWFSHHLRMSDKTNSEVPNVAIYGAGTAGIQLASALSFGTELKPVAFIDDKSSIHNHDVNGIKVYSPSQLKELINELGVKEILLALPSVSKTRIKEIISILEPFPVHVRTLPGVSELAQGKVKVEDLRDIDVNDLLGRDPVFLDDSLLSYCIKEKSVMVTGAGGSIGSELCRQIIQLGPVSIVLLEMSEFSLYSIHEELKSLKEKKRLDVEIVAVLGSVLSHDLVKMCCEENRVQTIYHAAAYKHVPIIEEHPYQGVRNNILGTFNMASVARQLSIETFVLISTDKAVRPTNVMGATKRFAELILQGMHSENSTGNNGEKNERKGTKFCMVRFGNVLGSSGSVVPHFTKQIREGGPVTVTHKDITRFFMTISEASQLVIQAGAMAEGGDVFLLDMGEPIRINDLARLMIRLSGLEVKDDKNPNGDIEIVYTGLRPGEKLYEELLIDDVALKTSHPGIMRAKEKAVPMNVLLETVKKFDDISLYSNKTEIKRILKSLVEEYAPAE